ncbi:MAG: DUF1289 domain-containing protein [Planctomycetes bacterium]|nr:DUF1289 domain-containing protein [Planctomycetota bacterium]
MTLPPGNSQPRRFDRAPSSPCINVCRIAAAGDYCVGCRRTRDEIARWWLMDAAQKAELWRKLATRRPDGSGEW